MTMIARKKRKRQWRAKRRKILKRLSRGRRKREGKCKDNRTEAAVLYD